MKNIFVVVALFFTTLCSANATIYEARDMGSGLGTGLKINNNGQFIESGGSRVWKVDGQVVDLNTIWPGQDISTCDINDAGQVAVYVNGEAYRWSQSGGFVRLTPLPSEWKSGPAGINENGDISGWYYIGGSGHACVWWADGTTTNLGVGIANDINDHDQVIGVQRGEDTEAVVWNHDGSITRIGGIGYGTEAINNASQVVGQYLDDIGLSHAFLWTQAGGVVYLDGLGAVGSEAYGINQAGQIVGWANVGINTRHAVLWETNLQISDLGTLPGFTYSAAYGINDLGWIVGYSSNVYNAIGNYHLTLWQPVPEPSSLATLGMALAGVGIGAVRRRRR